MKLGDWAACQRDAPSAGSWPRYEGKVGRIVAESPDPESDEFGVEFPGRQFKQVENIFAWFEPDELRPAKKPPWTGVIRLRRGAA